MEKKTSEESLKGEREIFLDGNLVSSRNSWIKKSSEVRGLGKKRGVWG